MEPLPVPSSDSTPDAAEASYVASARLFFVDDNADMRSSVARLLCVQWEVESFADGKTALEAARVRCPDLILSDDMMPGFDGVALVRALREDVRTATVPVILLSARAGKEAPVEEGLDAGADDYLVAPLTARELVARVNAHVKRARMRREAMAAIEAARDAAERANHAKDEFLAVLSHELRTPMTSILGWARMLASGAVPPDRLRMIAEGIDRSARLHARLVDDLLDMSGIINGKLFVERQPVVVATVLAEAVNRARVAAEPKGIALQMDISDERSVVEGDAARLQQIIGNLLANAVKFTPKGGVVTVQMDRHEDQVRIVVADNGQGIDADTLPHVFDRFRQGVDDRTRPHGGLGLGLAIVRYLVEAHEGRVVADSEGPGRGARFTVTLPLAAATAPAAATGSLDERLETVSAITKLIASGGSLNKVCDAIAEAAVGLLGARVARVWVNDAAARVISACGTFGVDPETTAALLDATVLPHGSGLPGSLVLRETPEYLADASTDPRWVNRRFIANLGVRGYAGLPLVAGDRVVGVLSVMFSEAREFTATDKTLLEMLSHHAAIALERAAAAPR